MSSRNIEDLYPLSPMQQGMLFHSLYAPESGMYFEQLNCVLVGSLNVAAFERAWQEVVSRHPVLRTSFIWEEVDEPLQVVHRQVEITFDKQDWCGVSEAERIERLEAYLEADRAKGFDLAEPPLMRLALMQLSDREHQFVWSNHHLLMDGWSMPLLLKEVFLFYEGYSRGSRPYLPLARPYRDYIAWLQKQDLQGAETFWRQALAGFDSPTPLVVDSLTGWMSSSHLEVDQEETGIQKYSLPTDVSQELRLFAQRNGLTLNTLIQGAWAILLSHYSGEQDVLFGATVSGRPPNLPGAENIIGMFINTLPVRVQVDFSVPLVAWLKELQTQQAALRQYEFSPLVQVQEWSELPRGQSLFDSILVFENYPVDETLREGGGSLQIRDVRHFSRTNFPLTLIAAPGQQIGLHVSYERSRFHLETVDRILSHLGMLLSSFVSQPDATVGQLNYLTPAEQRQLLFDWNQTAVDYVARGDAQMGDCVHHIFERQADRTPEAVAVRFVDSQGKVIELSYGDLNQQANQLAHYLVQSGSAPDDRIGLCIERSPEMIVGILAVLKAGSAYVPLDPNYPHERLAFMLDNAGVQLLITQESLLGRLPVTNAQVICIDSVSKPWLSEPGTNPGLPLRPDHLAYVIYTSGSTGQPKGVMIEHRALVNLALTMGDVFGLQPADRMMQFISISFDAAGEEIFPTLLRGATLVLPEPEIEVSGKAILDFCDQQAISICHLPAAFWHQMVAELQASGRPLPSSLKVMLVGGEAPSVERLQTWCRAAGEAGIAGSVRFINSYGPTEATISVANFQLRCDDERLGQLDRIPIGRPTANQRLYVLDARLQPVPTGVPGELFIGGPQVARGYLDQPELTDEKFAPDPFNNLNGEPGLLLADPRLYRTGDSVRWLPGGYLEFLGRVDQQVKLRGYRIELEEIEAVLMQLPGVRQAAAVVREDRPGDQRLVAYLVADQDKLSIPVVRDQLKEHLPEYMIPAQWVTLDSMPMTPGGKIDRRALPAPDQDVTDQETGYVAPRDAVEEIIAGVLADVLGVSRVGIHDHFFNLGGHSLLATQAVSRLRSAFGIELSLRALFENPTAAGIAQAIRGAQASPSALAVIPLEPAARETGEDGCLVRPLSFAQQRLWFLDQLEPGNLFYNIPMVVRLSGNLDRQALQRSLDEIVRRHESLRTTFDARDGLPVQVIAPPSPCEFHFDDLTTLSPEEKESQALELAKEDVRKPFELAQGPLLRVRLVRLEEQEHLAILVIHHIVSDGWSMGILVSELAALYAAFSQGQSSPLPSLPIQYADFAAWQRDWLQGEVLQEQLGYWKEQLAGLPPLLDLPTDRPRPAIKTSNGDIRNFSLPADMADEILALCRQEGVTLFMALLAAFQTLLYRYSGQEDIAVGSAIANRTRPEIEGLIGFFVNTLVLRSDLSGEPTFRELLARVREVALGAYAHQDLPFEMLVDALQPERNLSYTPLFQVGFDVQTTPLGGIELQDLRLEPVKSHAGTASFDLLISITYTGENLIGSMEYNTDLFDGATIERMLAHFQTLLAAALEDPDQAISSLPLLTAAERQQLLVDWNDTVSEVFIDQCAHQRFEAYVARQPSVPALLFADQVLTYDALDRRANQLARYLQKRGVGPDVLVGISTERSFEMIVAVLGVLKAGAAYLPLDPNYPPDRLSFMLADSHAAVLLTQEALVERIPGSPAVRICLDRDWTAIAQEDETAPSCAAGPGHLAYVIYTSGSTGQPKGALLRHRGLCNLSEAQRTRFNIQTGTRVLQFSPLSFDASVWETVMALGNGGILVLAPQETLASAIELHRLLKDQKINVVTLPPSMLSLLEDTNLPDLQTVIAAGEACSREIVNRWAPGRRFFDAYGPTETTVCASWGECLADDPLDPSIGRPLPNFQLYVLDQHMNPVPVGVPGELHVGGAGLARGYLNRPELTAEKFVPNPYFSLLPPTTRSILSVYGGLQGPPRLYRTGDLVRYRPDGKLEFLGRIDHQVKVRGFRIELGEVEAALRSSELLSDAVVIVREDQPGDKRLVAYLQPALSEGGSLVEVSIPDMRRFLRMKLPEYMLPSAFVVLEKLPVTPSGKLERKALPAPEGSRRDLEAEYVAPRTPEEEQLAGICSALLHLERVGVHDNFFELGGHSLLATQLISRVRDSFQVELPLKSLFEHPTIAELAEAIVALQASGVQEQAPTIQRVSREARRVKRSSLDKS